MNKMQATYTMIVITIIVILLAMAWKADSMSNMITVYDQHGHSMGTVNCNRAYSDDSLTLTTTESNDGLVVQYTTTVLISDVCK
jgi:hypothetical protein